MRQAGLEVLFTILAASTQRESAWRPRTRRLVAWAATSWARTAIAIKRVRATLQFEDEGQDARSRMAKELTALAEVGFSRMVRPHLPQAVVEDLYPR